MSLKITYASFWRLWERKFLQPHYLKMIRSEQNLSPERLRELQEKKLFKILVHAAAHVPYYREYFAQKPLPSSPNQVWETLKKMPLLEKKSIQQTPQRFISETASLRGTTRWPTGGSTGQPLFVITKPTETAYNQTLVRYGFLEAGAKPGQKILKIRNMVRSFSGVKKNAPDLLRWHRLDMKNSLDEHIQAINSLKPEILYSFPTYLSLLSQHIQDHHLKIAPAQRVFTYGEVLMPSARDLIAKIFQCPVLDTYGSAEFHRIAYECEKRKFHVLESSVIVEALPSSPADNEAGLEGQEILLTSLYHKMMPLIRYRIGDRTVFSKDPCPCGKSGMTLEKIIGRQDDCLTLPSGRRISSRLVNRLDEIPHVLEYQIIQKKTDLIEVWVRPSSHFVAEQEKEIRRLVLAGCYGEAVRIEIRLTGELKRSSIGKLKAVVSEVKTQSR